MGGSVGCGFLSLQTVFLLALQTRMAFLPLVGVSKIFFSLEDTPYVSGPRPRPMKGPRA